jgi:hypothetical protein
MRLRDFNALVEAMERDIKRQNSAAADNSRGGRPRLT